MDWAPNHPAAPDAAFDGGDLDCGNGLLLLIRQHLDPLRPGQLLEIRSTEPSVDEDLPAWARLTGNELVSRTKQGRQRSFLVRKTAASGGRQPPASGGRQPPETTVLASPGPQGADAPRSPLPPFAVMGVGSWPRPRWLVRAIHEYLEGRLGEDEYQQTADDAVRLAVAAQERAGVDVVTDGEQRRDSYAGFVGRRLDGCQLVPITDLLPYVADPEHFAAELKALDVPASDVRQPVVRAPLRRSRPIAGHELAFVQSVTTRPAKVALPGPYLLTRLLSLDCVSDKTYADRDALAADVVRVLREEAAALLAAGAAIVQFDEPVLTEVVFGRPAKERSFMCGALAARLDPDAELAFAGALFNRVTQGLPKARLAVHVCRGNWSRDESVALHGDYAPLLPLLKSLHVGTYFLELCTPRAGELAVLRDLPADARIGVGVVNQKRDAVESPDEIVAKAEPAVALFGPDRVLLNPDCGFATFADNPVASAAVAEAKLAAIAEAARRLRQKYVGSAQPS